MPCLSYIFLSLQFNVLRNPVTFTSARGGGPVLPGPARRREFDAVSPSGNRGRPLLPRYQIVTRSGGARYILSPGPTLNAW
jgi:hypothetical protein